MNLKNIITALFLVFIILIIAFILACPELDQYILETIQHNALKIQQFVTTHFFLACLCYIGMIALAIILFLPLGVLLAACGGFFFGVAVGTILTLIGIVIGNSVVFVLIRYLLQDVLIGYVTRYSKFGEFKNEIEKNGFCYLLFLQFMPATPSFLINLCAGLTNVSLSIFITTSILGSLPQTIVYTGIGRNLHKLDEISMANWWPFLIILGMIACLILLPIIMQKKK
jgi:uncharacterized membrane protein YdjX (TVP38/TMEM64 family)